MSQFFVSNSGSSPTPPTPSPTFQTMSDFDDFIGSAGAGGGIFPKLGLRSNHALVKVAGTATNPGIIQMQNGLFEGNMLCTTSQDPLCFAIGGGVLKATWILDLTALSDGTNTYSAYIGLSDAKTVDGPIKPQNGIWFQYTDLVNSGNWQIVCGTGGIYTTTNTSVAATTGFVNFTLEVNAAGTSVSYKIDSVSVGTVATNIPSSAIGPFVMTELIANDVYPTNIDLFYYEQTLTASRI